LERHWANVGKKKRFSEKYAEARQGEKKKEGIPDARKGAVIKALVGILTHPLRKKKRSSLRNPHTKKEPKEKNRQKQLRGRGGTNDKRWGKGAGQRGGGTK